MANLLQKLYPVGTTFVCTDGDFVVLRHLRAGVMEVMDRDGVPSEFHLCHRAFFVKPIVAPLRFTNVRRS